MQLQSKTHAIIARMIHLKIIFKLLAVSEVCPRTLAGGFFH